MWHPIERSRLSAALRGHTLATKWANENRTKMRSQQRAEKEYALSRTREYFAIFETTSHFVELNLVKSARAQSLIHI